MKVKKIHVPKFGEGILCLSHSFKKNFGEFSSDFIQNSLLFKSDFSTVYYNGRYSK